MNVGESVVLVRRVDGFDEGTRGRIKDMNADRVVVECKVQERSAVVLTHTWDVLPNRLWERLMRRRTSVKKRLKSTAGTSTRSVTSRG